MSANIPQTTQTSTSAGANKVKYKCRATQTYPLYSRLLPGEPCFVDIEFQKYKPASSLKQIHRIGRIAILNSKGEVVLDVFAIYPREEGQKKCWQPAQYGVVWQDLLFENGGKAAQNVERWVAEIVKDRTVVLHGGKHDRTAFYYEEDIWATSKIVDTQKVYSSHQSDGTPGLSNLCSSVLERSIQTSEHSPVEDANAMRELYFLKFTYDRPAERPRLAKKAAAPEKQTAKPAAHQQPYKKQNGSAKKKARKAAAKLAATAMATAPVPGI